MSAFADEFAAAAGMLDERFGETILYHRGLQTLTITGAIKGFPRVEALAYTREPAQAELHLVDWTFELSQLDGLLDTDEDQPDWIEDADGDRYTVMPVVGDADWDYASPDKLRVRVHTFPDVEDS
jgi:hypothetical protein